nr:uncharacterized protein LOC128693667 [Cherax quadricarinatus]
MLADIVQQALLTEMSAIEMHHFFGNISDPIFHLVKPRLYPNVDSGQPGHVRLIIRSPDLSVDSVLAPSEGLVAPHVSAGVYIDGVLVPFMPFTCHYRSTNATHVVTVNNCDNHVLDGIIITADQLATLHPLLQRFQSLVEEHLPCDGLIMRYNDTTNNNTSTEGVFGLHIFHILKRDEIPVHGRRRREAEEGNEEPSVCATGPEHYLRGSIRNLSELRPSIDQHLDDDVNKFQKPVIHSDIQEHKVGTSPVTVVVRKTLELAVFGDVALYQSFPLRVGSSDKSSLINYILTIVDAVQGIYHQEELQGYVIDIVIVRLDIQTTNDGPNTSGGDIGGYLTSFCSWQQSLNPASDSDPNHWDHALMLSGLDLTSSGDPSVIGLAWVGGMCRPSISCTMNEGRSFVAVYVVAHEMGHNFGMVHDGQGNAQQCSGSKYIMSPSVGPGKTTWSPCSLSVLHSFLSQPSCLHDGSGASGVADDSGASGVADDNSASGVADDSGASGVADDSGASGVADDSGASGVADDNSASGVADGSGALGVNDATDRTSNDVQEGLPKKEKESIEYPNVPTVIRSVPQGESLPVRDAPTSVSFESEEESGEEEEEKEDSAWIKRNPGLLLESRWTLKVKEFQLFPLPVQPLAKDLCAYLYCTNGVVTKPAHPALEGSFCGSHRVCIAGKCRPEDELANLTLYNEPNIPHSSVTPQSPTTRNPPLTTTTVPSHSTSTEEPSTTIVDASTSSSVPGTTSSLPPTETPGPGACSCNFTTNISDILKNIPKTICPFLAPVYHPLFSCGSGCSEYDLHVDISSGSLTTVSQQIAQLGDATDLCFFESYSIISDKEAKIKTDNILVNRSSSIKAINTCLAIPQLLHPPLHCPIIAPVDLEINCAPQNIILKASGYNLTYVQVKDDGNLNKTVQWKGNSYTLIKETRSTTEEQDHVAPFISRLNRDSMSSKIKCDLETKFPKELQNLPKEVCKFLAPSLHELFNCFSDIQCPEYVLFLDLLDNTITKVPLKTPTELKPPCLSCDLGETNINISLLKAVDTLGKSSVNVRSLCRLLPSSWLGEVPSCNSPPVYDTISQDTCLPIVIVILLNKTAFTYISHPEDKTNSGTPTIKWLEKPYFLEKVTKNKNMREILEDEYVLDFEAYSSRKSLSNELSITPHKNSRTLSLHFNDSDKVMKDPEPSAGNITSLDISQRSGGGDVVEEALREYVGQNDVFLPLNAPKAMPRTKVGPCSVTCGQGMHYVHMECVDVTTGELLNEDSCQGYIIPKEQLEPCHMPPCQDPRWSVGEWGSCSERCGAGVQFRRVDCIIPINQREMELKYYNSDLRIEPQLIVKKQECGEEAPLHVRNCEGNCQPD